MSDPAAIDRGYVRRSQPDRRYETIGALATRQGGVIARRQLLALGVGADAVDGWVRTRRLLVVHAGVYALGHRALGAAGYRHAAVLSAGSDAVLSHRSAAEAWGIRPNSRCRGP